MYCSACWEQHVAQIQRETLAAEAVGAVSMLPQSLDAISNYCMFSTQNLLELKQLSDHDINSVSDIRATSATTQGFQLSAASTLLNHLVVCSHQPEDVRERAQVDPPCKKSTSPSRGRRSSNTRTVLTDHQTFASCATGSWPITVSNPFTLANTCIINASLRSLAVPSRISSAD